MPPLPSASPCTPCVGNGAQEANAVGTGDGVPGTQGHHRRHCLSKSLLDLLHHPTTRQLFNPVGVRDWKRKVSIHKLPKVALRK